MLEDNGGIGRESEQKNDRDNFLGGEGGEAKERGELEDREGQSNTMARSFMRQAYYSLKTSFGLYQSERSFVHNMST